MSAESQEETAEDEYYYYYYEYDQNETSAPSQFPTMISNNPSASPTEIQGEFYYVYEYYYYYPTQESNENMNKEDKGDNKENPIGNEINKEEFKNKVTTPSISPSSPTTIVDGVRPTESPSEEYYYYYYGEEDDSSPRPSQIKSKLPSSQPTEQEYYYYYYYEDIDSASPSSGPSIESLEGVISYQIATGRGCHDYLLSALYEAVHTNDISFTFTLETSKTLLDWNKIATEIMEKTSSSILRCDSKDGHVRKAHGIFLIHFPAKEPLIKVNDCEPVTNGSNNCIVFSGHMTLSSNKIITAKESHDAYISIQAAVDSLNNLNEGIAFAKYLGPLYELQSNHSSWEDQIVVALSVIFSIPILFLIYRIQRKCSIGGYRRVTFAANE